MGGVPGEGLGSTRRRESLSEKEEPDRSLRVEKKTAASLT